MNIKEKRISLNLTQKNIATQLNVSRTTVAMWETGHSKPRVDTLIGLAKILKCNIDELLTDRKVV